MTNLVSKIAPLCWLSALLLGCAQTVTPFHPYTAVVERIEARPGEHYSLTHGYKPLYCIYLRPTEHHAGLNHGLLRVLLFDLYSSETHGQTGDLVIIRFPGLLPRRGQIWFDQLSAYTVLKKATAQRSSGKP